MGTLLTSEPRRTAEYKFAELRARLQRNQANLLNFALGGYRPPPPSAVIDLIESIPHLVLEAAGEPELTRLREDLAAMLSRDYDVSVSPDSILVTPSARSAMSALVTSLLRPGDQVLATTPGYPVFAELAAARGARVDLMRLRPADGFAPNFSGIEPDELANVALVGLNYPNNPTGAVVTDEVMTDLLERIPTEALLFNDATYAPLVYTGERRSMLCDVPESGGPPVLELHSLTKVFALGPMGMAVLAGPARLVDAVRRESEFMWSPLSALHVRVARECAADWNYLTRLRSELAERVARLTEVLDRAGFHPFPAAAGTYVLCDAPSSLNGSWLAGASEACETLLSEHGLATVAWDAPDGGYLRFSALYQETDLAALTALGDELSLEYRE